MAQSVSNEHLLIVYIKQEQKKFADLIILFSWIFKILRKIKTFGDTFLILSIHKPYQMGSCEAHKKYGPGWFSRFDFFLFTYKQTNTQTRKEYT